ncbi:hypothetical protein Acr_01g0006480 [Actinidia rufa]|uniref:Reverse transcriptase Ty1/copia-type domain-containing protein n=1 Tax=Actinidia rufa TaxID=165716 RepID=A0A7J0E4G8_9ERIC|nr:hypothetical protein Acr_01g0006480 [Actinidia rufa]
MEKGEGGDFPLKKLARQLDFTEAPAAAVLPEHPQPPPPRQQAVPPQQQLLLVPMQSQSPPPSIRPVAMSFLVKPNPSFSLKLRYQGEENMNLIDSIEGLELGDVGHFKTPWTTRLTTSPTFDDRPNLTLIPLVKPNLSFSLKPGFLCSDLTPMRLDLTPTIDLVSDWPSYSSLLLLVALACFSVVRACSTGLNLVSDWLIRFFSFCFFLGLGLWGYVSGAIKRPTDPKESDPKKDEFRQIVNKWDRENAQLFTWFHNSVQPSTYMNFFETSDDREKQQLIQFLMAIRDQFEPLRSANRASLPSVDGAVHELIAEETRLKVHHISPPAQSVFATSSVPHIKTPAPVLPTPASHFIQVTSKPKPQIPLDECIYCHQKHSCQRSRKVFLDHLHNLGHHSSIHNRGDSTQASAMTTTHSGLHSSSPTGSGDLEADWDPAVNVSVVTLSLDVKNAFFNGYMSEEIGFQPIVHDSSLFVYHTSHGLVLLLLYVDDMIITDCDFAAISDVKDHLFYGVLLEDPTFYRELMGCLVYLTVTRPDTSYVVHISLLLSSTSSLILRAYADVDWTSDLSDCKSTSSFCVFLGDSLVSWKNKKQLVVACSTAETEYRSMAHATSEIVWLCWLLFDMGVTYSSPTPFYCANKSAIQIAHNSVFHERTKHIEIVTLFVSICSPALLFCPLFPVLCSWLTSSRRLTLLLASVFSLTNSRYSQLSHPEFERECECIYSYLC